MTQSNLTQQQRQTALVRLLQLLPSASAHLVAYAAAAGAIYCLYPHDPAGLMAASPVLANLVAAIGGDVLAGILERVANLNDPSPANVEKLLQESLGQTKLATARLEDLPTKRELYRAISLLDAKRDERLQQLLATQNALILAQFNQLLQEIRNLYEREPDKPAFDEAAALENYLTWVQAQYGTMRVLSMTRPVPLESVYTDVYVLHKESYWRQNAAAERERLFAQRREQFFARDRTAGVAMLTQTNRLFIVGQPGAGKTTFLRWLALQAAQGMLAPVRIPLYVELRRLNSWTGSLFTLLAHQLALGGFPDGEDRLTGWLRQGRVLLLLDGLDEVLAERRHTVNDEIADLAKMSGDSCLLLTCRPHAETRRFEHFTYVQVADFAEPQVTTFVRNWFQVDTARADSLLHELRKNEHQSIRELARTPLLLALLCIAYEEKAAFPRQRSELYSRALRVVLAQWDEERGVKRESAYGKLTDDRKAALLAYLAYHTFAQGQYFILQQRLVELVREFWYGWRQALIKRQQMEYGQVYPPELPPPDVDAAALIAEIAAQHGLLVAQAEDRYSFSHLTLQEYFTARYIVDNAAAGTLPRLMQHVGEDRWREVFLLTAGMLYEATEFARQYLAALAWMTAQDKTVTEMLQWGVQQSAQSRSGVQPPALRALLIYRNLLFALSLAWDRDHDLASALDFDQTFDLARDHDLVYELALDRGLTDDLEYDLDGVLVLARNLAFDRDDLDLTLDRDDPALYFNFCRDLALALAVTYDLGLVRDLFVLEVETIQNLRTWSSHQEVPDWLRTALANLSVPMYEYDADPAAWKLFDLEMETILLRHWGLAQFWELSVAQVDLLASYLEANRLLLQCLAVASVPDREAIEAQMLLPSQQATENR